jgi:hypothetical protein
LTPFFQTALLLCVPFEKKKAPDFGRAREVIHHDVAALVNGAGFFPSKSSGFGEWFGQWCTASLVNVVNIYIYI